MSNRNTTIQDMVIDEFGEDVDDLDAVIRSILEEYPKATNQEISDFLVDMLLETDEILDIDELVEDFSTEWGRK